MYTAVYMLAGDGEVFETYQKRTTLISEWGRVARYHSRVGHRRCWTAAASKGLLSLVCVVVVLVAMRFASYTLAFDGHVGRSRVLIHTTKVTDVLSVGCTYLGSRADMRYVRMWYIIRHTKTKIIARVHTCTRHTRRLFFWDVSIRNSLRSNNTT